MNINRVNRQLRRKVSCSAVWLAANVRFSGGTTLSETSRCGLWAGLLHVQDGCFCRLCLVGLTNRFFSSKGLEHASGVW